MEISWLINYDQTTLTPEEEKMAFNEKKRMYVVRLPDSGEVLLYNCVRIR